ncbi:hypothetical protein T492DRAFT_913466 [Pavlovales sp. CCMP2436]|nr:hypothetical protein T492DRAFT_913466 [Pavlovales sp. CCMP2436]
MRAAVIAVSIECAACRSLCADRLAALPVSTLPVSALPVSALPVSALPVSALPVSALPVSTLPVSALPVSALPVCPACLGSASSAPDLSGTCTASPLVAVGRATACSRASRACLDAAPFRNGGGRFSPVAARACSTAVAARGPTKRRRARPMRERPPPRRRRRRRPATSPKGRPQCLSASAGSGRASCPHSRQLAVAAAWQRWTPPGWTRHPA